jgi:purine nucleosidase
MERIIIDTDPGVDDALAIMMALVHPGVKVEALTVVAGNVGLEHTVPNTCKILDLMGADVPVYAGCDRAFLHSTEDAAQVHGADGLGDVGIPVSSRPVEEEHASVALVRIANREPGEITLVTIGPLTNLAVALKLDLALPRKFKRLVIMGGAIYGHGNTSSISAEFNIYADPEAAHVVFESWPEVTLVSWEATLAHSIPAAQLKKWWALGTPRAQFYRQISGKAVDFITSLYGRTDFFAADSLALAVVLEPDIVNKKEAHHVAIEIDGRYTRGQTMVDWNDQSGKSPNAHIILEVDRQRFYDLMENALR